MSSNDFIAMNTAYKIEDIFAQGFIGGRAQRHATVQLLIMDLLEHRDPAPAEAPPTPPFAGWAWAGGTDLESWRAYAEWLRGLRAPAKNIQASLVKLTAAIHNHIAREAVRPALKALQAFKEGPGPTARKGWMALAKDLDAITIKDFPSGMTPDEMIILDRMKVVFIEAIRSCFGDRQPQDEGKTSENKGVDQGIRGVTSTATPVEQRGNDDRNVVDARLPLVMFDRRVDVVRVMGWDNGEVEIITMSGGSKLSFAKAYELAHVITEAAAAAMPKIPATKPVPGTDNPLSIPYDYMVTIAERLEYECRPGVTTGWEFEDANQTVAKIKFIEGSALMWTLRLRPGGGDLPPAEYFVELLRLTRPDLCKTRHEALEPKPMPKPTMKPVIDGY